MRKKDVISILALGGPAFLGIVSILALACFGITFIGCQEQKGISTQKDLELEDENTLVGLGWNYRTQGDHILSTKAFKKAIEINPKNDSAYVGLGWVYQINGEFPLSEEAFKKAIEINPSNEWAYVGLGEYYRNIGDIVQFKKQFKKALEINPANSYASSEINKY